MPRFGGFFVLEGIAFRCLILEPSQTCQIDVTKLVRLWDSIGTRIPIWEAESSTEEAERKNRKKELKKETKTKVEKTEKEETKKREEEINKETWLEPTHMQTTGQQGDLPLETAATETAGEETTEMRQAVGQQPLSNFRKPRSSNTSESDEYQFYDEHLTYGDPTKSFKPAGNDVAENK